MSEALFPHRPETARQGELFAAEQSTSRDYRPEPEKVRGRLVAMLGQAREADVLPWPKAKARLYQTIFPQMTLWLPEDEGVQLRLEFEREMGRLMTS